MEVKNAFLHEELDGEIYMTQPKSFKNVVGIISWCMQSPKKPHMNAAQQILKYVKSTIEYDILYKGSKDCKLVGYCDADYARDHNTKSLTAMYVFKFGSVIIS